MSVRSIAEIMEEMLRSYKRRPALQNKWRILAGRDDYGYNDFFIYGPGIGLWQIKGELRNPYELIGAGTKVAAKKIDDEIRRVIEQGVPMPFGLISPHPQMKDRAIIAAGVGRYQESMEQFRSVLPSRQNLAEIELKQKLDDLRRKFGLDAAYR